jgi:hypothetical protein
VPVAIVLAAAVILGGVVVVAMGRGGELGRERPDRPVHTDFRTWSDVAEYQPPPALLGYDARATQYALSLIARTLAERDAEIAWLRDRIAELRPASSGGVVVSGSLADSGSLGDSVSLADPGSTVAQGGTVAQGSTGTADAEAGLGMSAPDAAHAAESVPPPEPVEEAVADVPAEDDGPTGELPRISVLEDHQLEDHQAEGQVPPSQLPADEVPGGQVPGGQVPGGQVPGGQVPGDGSPGDLVPGDQAPGRLVPGDSGSQWFGAPLASDAPPVEPIADSTAEPAAVVADPAADGVLVVPEAAAERAVASAEPAAEPRADSDVVAGAVVPAAVSADADAGDGSGE